MANNNKPTQEEDLEFNWIQARNDAGLTSYDVADNESKFMKKMSSNPFVPIGCLFTTACLTLGLLSMRSGNQKMSQLMMRGRVLAQGFTVVAIVAGVSIKAVQDM